MLSAPAYLKTTLFLAVFFLSCLASFNWLVDPFDLNGNLRVPGLNAIPGKSFNTPMLTKAYIVRRVRPKAIVLGSSRADHGLDVNHPGWDAAAQPRYNLSIERADIYELMRFLEHAQSIQPLSQVVFGLDFFMFNRHEGHPEGFEDNILGDATGQHYFQALLRHFQTLVSMDTFLASQYTLLHQDKMKPLRDSFGRRTALTYEQRLAAHGSGRAMFLKHLSNLEHGPFSLKYDFGDTSPNSPLDCFRRILETARRGNIDLRLFIAPTHALEQEVWISRGYEPTVEQWRRELVRILAEDAAGHPDSPPIPLWDFSGYNGITTETLPASGDAAGMMRWYWEPSHFKQAVGDLILDKIFDHREPGREAPADFGVKLDAGNVDSHLAHIRAMRAAYRPVYAPIFATLDEQ